MGSLRRARRTDVATRFSAGPADAPMGRAARASRLKSPFRKTREALTFGSASAKTARSFRNRSFRFWCSADRSPADSNRKTGDMLVDHFHPGDPDAHRRIERGSKARSVQSNRLQRVSPAAPGCAADESADCSPAVNWIAYRLELKHPQRPHRLVVEMAAKGHPFVGISVLEPNGPADGALPAGIGPRGRPVAGVEHGQTHFGFVDGRPSPGSVLAACSRAGSLAARHGDRSADRSRQRRSARTGLTGGRKDVRRRRSRARNVSSGLT